MRTTHRLAILTTIGLAVLVPSFLLVWDHVRPPKLPDGIPEPVTVHLPPEPRPAATAEAIPVAPAPRPATPWDMYYQLRTGAWWLYVEDGTEWAQVVTAVAAGENEAVVSAGRVGMNGMVAPREKVAVSGRGLVLLEENGVRCTPPPYLFKLPVREKGYGIQKEYGVWVGDEFLADPIGLPDLSGGARDGSLSRGWMSGYENVSVPAGVFRAAKVVVGGGEIGGLVVPLKEVCWYAPGVGLVKRTLTPEGRSETLSELVLEAFSPGRD